MDNSKRWLYLWTVFFACFSSLLSYAQPAIKTFVDKNEILIGDQFKLRVEANFSPDDYKLRWLQVPDSLGHFEVISRSKIDSVYSNNRLTGVTQTFTLTSFDSGKWALPSFLIGIDPVKDDTTVNYFTDSVPVTVSFSTSDTTNQLRDIKPIRDVSVINPLWYWIGGGVLLLIAAVIAVWLYRKYKKKKPSIIPVKSGLSAYDEAMLELKNLQQYNFSIPGDLKVVHSNLAELLKRYLSRRENNNFLNNTTGDILLLLSGWGVDKAMVSKIAAALRCGDAVKFAKFIPAEDETYISIASVKELIESFHQKKETRPVDRQA